MERKYCSSVYVVDFKNQKTLLMYNKKIDKWLQPGGHIKSEIFELPSECAKREALEETCNLLDKLPRMEEAKDYEPTSLSGQSMAAEKIR